MYSHAASLSGKSSEPMLWLCCVGQRWRDMRSTVSPVFTSSKMKTMIVLVKECSEQLLDFLEQSYQQPQETGYKIKKGKPSSTFIINVK
jgi:cytochrome P450